MIRLRRGFTAAELEWKIQTCGKTANGKLWARPVPYVSARAVIKRLDEVFGPLGYSIGFTPTNALGKAAMICRIQAGEVYREDVCEETDIEPAKGAASGALKRAAVQFGIGAYLYDAPEFWAVVDEDLKSQLAYFGKTKDGTRFKWDLPQEALQWILSTLDTSTAGSVAIVPPQSGTSTTASPPPSQVATTSAPARPFSTSGVKMPGKEGMWSGHAGLPIGEVPDSILETASDHYATKTGGKFGKLAQNDLNIISEEMSRRYGPPKTVNVPAKAAGAHDGDPGPEEPGDLDQPDDDDTPPW